MIDITLCFSRQFRYPRHAATLRVPHLADARLRPRGRSSVPLNILVVPAPSDSPGQQTVTEQGDSMQCRRSSEVDITHRGKVERGFDRERRGGASPVPARRVSWRARRRDGVWNHQGIRMGARGWRKGAAAAWHRNAVRRVGRHGQAVCQEGVQGDAVR